MSSLLNRENNRGTRILRGPKGVSTGTEETVHHKTITLIKPNKKAEKRQRGPVGGTKRARRESKRCTSGLPEGGQSVSGRLSNFLDFLPWKIQECLWGLSKGARTPASKKRKRRNSEANKSAETLRQKNWDICAGN